MKTKRSRREFFRYAAAAAAASLVSRVQGAAAGHPVRIGGLVFASDEDPQLWAQSARRFGYGAVYVPDCSLADQARIEAVRKAAAEQDLVIAEVGRWVNLLDPCPEEAKKNLDYVTEGLALAEELGACCCVDIAGSFCADPWYGPDPRNNTPEYFDRAVENARKIIDAVKPTRTKFAYEMSGWNCPSSTDEYLRLIDAIDRPQFGVHLDICNIVNSPRKFWGTTALANDVFDRLGEKIVSCHAKDLRWEPEMNIHFVECVCGEGCVDWGTMLKRLAALPADVPLMIEHMRGEGEYRQSLENLKRIAGGSGVEVF